MAELFVPSPGQWGLRGDPYLWRAMEIRLGGLGIPANQEALMAELCQGFEALTGQPVTTQEAIFVPAFAGGGMSSGHVSAVFWRDTAIPLILSRFDTIR